MSAYPYPLQIFGIYDRGKANSERIVLRVYAPPVDLRFYALVLGHAAPENTVIPLQDQFLWLGPTVIQVPSWIFVFTGAGSTGISQETTTKDPVHLMFWNRTEVMLASKQIYPTLIRMDHIEIGRQDATPVGNLLQQQPSTELAEALRKLIADNIKG